MSTDDGHEALAAIEAAWNSAAKRWDPQALASNYAVDALFFGGRPSHAVGNDAILGYFVSYEGVIESASMKLVDQHVVELGPDTYLAQGYADFSLVLFGQRSTKTFLRTTLIMVLEHGRWHIRQQHFSPEPAVPPLGDSQAESRRRS